MAASSLTLVVAMRTLVRIWAKGLSITTQLPKGHRCETSTLESDGQGLFSAKPSGTIIGNRRSHIYAWPGCGSYDPMARKLGWCSRARRLQYTRDTERHI